MRPKSEAEPSSVLVGPAQQVCMNDQGELSKKRLVVCHGMGAESTDSPEQSWKSLGEGNDRGQMFFVDL